MYFSPDLSFLSAIAGVLLIYVEFLRPGKIFPGLAGCVLLVTGSYGVWQNAPTLRGLLLFAVSAPLFLLEIFINTRFFAGLFGTVCLALGALVLFDRPSRIHPVLACVLPLLFGSLTTFLAQVARKARRSKWADPSQDR